LQLKIVADWNKDNGHNVQLLFGWPPNPPDLKLVEDLFAVVERRVYWTMCDSLHRSKRCVEGHILPKSYDMKRVLTRLYESMPSRTAKLIECGGGNIGY
jgi:hypothetical protein